MGVKPSTSGMSTTTKPLLLPCFSRGRECGRRRPIGVDDEQAVLRGGGSRGRAELRSVKTGQLVHAELDQPFGLLVHGGRW